MALLLVIGSLLGVTHANAQTVPFTFTGAGAGGSLVISWSSSITFTIGTTPNTGNSPGFVIQSAGDIFGTTATTPSITSTATYSRTSPSPIGPFSLTNIESHFVGGNTAINDIFLFTSGGSVSSTLAVGDTFVLSAGSVTLASFSGTVPTSGSYSIFFADTNGKNLGIGSAIPEPSTYAAIFGAAMLGFAAWRRRRVPASAGQ